MSCHNCFTYLFHTPAFSRQFIICWRYLDFFVIFGSRLEQCRDEAVSRCAVVSLLQPVVSASRKETTEPVVSASRKEATEPVVSASRKKTTEPVVSASGKETTEPVVSASRKETTEPVVSASRKETFEPVVSASGKETTEPVVSASGKETIYWINSAVNLRSAARRLSRFFFFSFKNLSAKHDSLWLSSY